MGDIRNKKVFAEKVESFASVIDALIADQETREMYEKDPLLALKKYGIEFKDEKIAVQVEEQLRIKPKEWLDLDIPNPRMMPGPFAYAYAIAVTNATDLDRFADSLYIDNERYQHFLRTSHLRK